MREDRFKRNAGRRGIRLQRRDLRIVEDVYWARYLTNQQIARLHFSLSKHGKATSQCKQRIRYLFDRGFLRKRKAYINEPDVYFRLYDGDVPLTGPVKVNGDLAESPDAAMAADGHFVVTWSN